MNQYKVIVYDKVKQNEQGLWVIVESHKTFDILDIEDIEDTKAILKQLKAVKIINTIDLRKVVVEGTSYKEIKEKKGKKPICRIERLSI